jgi:hypothetical protein
MGLSFMVIVGIAALSLLAVVLPVAALLRK